MRTAWMVVLLTANLMALVGPTQVAEAQERAVLRVSMTVTQPLLSPAARDSALILVLGDRSASVRSLPTGVRIVTNEAASPVGPTVAPAPPEIRHVRTVTFEYVAN